jgi:hypothetical protein
MNVQITHLLLPCPHPQVTQVRELLPEHDTSQPGTQGPYLLVTCSLAGQKHLKGVGGRQEASACKLERTSRLVGLRLAVN